MGNLGNGWEPFDDSTTIRIPRLFEAAPPSEKGFREGTHSEEALTQ
jgi:hypothetical protein